MKIKRIVAVLLFVCLLFSCIPPVQTNAAEEDYYTYSVSNGRATITDCKSTISGAITIPSILGGYPVTAIGNCAFDYCSNLTSVEIPGSVTTIGQEAFLYCTGLKTVTLNDGIVTIGNRAFGDCTGLTSVVVPNSVTIIDHGAFSYCTLLTTASLPDGLTFVGEGVFRNCSRLQYNIYGNARYLGNENNPYAVLAQATSQTIMDCQIHTDTKVISGGAFEECKNLTSIEIPYGVKGISDSAFAYCTQLITVNIPDSVVRIGSYVFEFCSGLTEASIPNSVTTMGTRVFYYCQSLSSINLSNQLKSIGSLMFYNCISLTSVTIPNGVTTIDSEAFYGCTELKTLNIPYSITLVQGNAFKKCSKLTMVTFCGTADQWQKIEIGSSNDPLKNASRQYHNWNPATCVVPKTCSVCGMTEGEPTHDWIDANCTTPKTCTLCGVTEGEKQPHTYENGICTVCGAMNCPYTYEIVDGQAIITGYTGEGGDITIPSTLGGYPVTTIGDSAFYRCSSLTAVTIPDSVTRIGSSAFYECSNLYTVGFGNGITTISAYAFYQCDRLKAVKLPDSVTTIGNAAFYYCKNVNSLSLGNGVVTIGEGAFYDFGSMYLNTVIIPVSLRTVGRSAFFNFHALRYVYYCGTAEQWNEITVERSNDILLRASRQYHKWNAATCTTPQTCSLCGVTQGDVVHSYTFEVTAPTCDEQGYTTYTCSVCGDSYVDSYVDVTAHTYEDGVCIGCGQQLAEAIELSGDGKVTTFDAQILAEAKAGLRTLTDEQWQALGELQVSDIIDYVLGRSPGMTTEE